MLRRFSLVFFTILVIIPTSLFSTERITSEGIGYSRNGAIRSALRSAVEQGVGSFLTSETVVDNSLLISDKILSHTDGYVKKYTVVSESEEFGLIKVAISAEVEKGSIEKDLIAQKLLYEIKNKPRFMIILDERSENVEMFDKTATQRFEEVIIEKGFKLVEPEQLEKVKSMASGDLAAFGFRHGADLVIRGKVNTGKPQEKKLYGKTFFSVPVQLSARVVRTDNAEIIASKSKSMTKSSRHEFSATNFGLTIAGEALAQELIEDLNKFWKEGAYNENTIELMIAGSGNLELGPVEAALRKVACIRNVRIRFLEGNNAYYDVDLRGTVHDIRDALSAPSFSGLEVISLTANRIGLKAKDYDEAIGVKPQMASVDITSFSIADIFPARARSYENENIVKVGLKASGSGSGNVKIGVFVPELMALPAELQVNRLSGEATKDFALPLLFEQSKLMEIADGRSMYGQVTISFSENGKAVERKLTAPTMVYGRNAIDWTEPLSLGGFVTYQSPDLISLAKRAVTSVKTAENENKNLFQGMVLFQLLKELGISYVKDPAVIPGTRVVDMVQFPQETLERKSGDCDDLAVLYAALLSSIGIPAAVISYPDHVLVMFDSGVFEKNRYSLSSDASRTIVHNGTVWIPVETTMLQKGFSEAWHVASSEFHTALAENQNVAIIDLQKAWKKFPPVSLGAKTQMVTVPDIAQAVAEEKAAFAKRISNDISNAANALAAKGASGKLEESTSIAAANTLGIFYARSNRFEEAAETFKKVAKKSQTPAALSNQACALLLQGEEKDALKILEANWKKDASGRIAVNRALCLYAMATDAEQSEAFIAAFKDAMTLVPSAEKLGEYLGLDLGIQTDTRAEGEHGAAEQQKVNLRRLKELIRQRVLAEDKKRITGTTTETSTGTKITGTTTETSTGQVSDSKKPKVLPFGGIRGADPEQISKIIDLLYWFEDISQ